MNIISIFAILLSLTCVQKISKGSTYIFLWLQQLEDGKRNSEWLCVTWKDSEGKNLVNQYKTYKDISFS